MKTIAYFRNKGIGREMVTTVREKILGNFRWDYSRTLAAVICVPLLLLGCANPAPHSRNKVVGVREDVQSAEEFQKSQNPEFTHPRGDITVWKQVTIPQLDRTRRISIYTPPGYAESSQRYPVVYMHDGQNVFDRDGTGFGSWYSDRAADAWVAEGILPGVILVAIDNSRYREQEYLPYSFAEVAPAYRYARFIAETLKPRIDAEFRTLPGREHTVIGGASFGGVAAMYAALSFPETFGKAAVFSPVIRTVRTAFLAYVRSYTPTEEVTWYISGGEKEGTFQAEDVAGVLGESGFGELMLVLDPQGDHNERSWGAAFWTAVPWLLGAAETAEPQWF